MESDFVIGREYIWVQGIDVTSSMLDCLADGLLLPIAGIGHGIVS